MADPHTPSERDRVAIDTIRFLAVDMVEKANSGHPGAPMGQAAMAYMLWSRFLRFDPQRPDWPNRDRFVLSCGHASAMLYALLHLAGYELSLDELRDFRQLGSMTPGHPEHGLTPGVEMTTGPLGQGLSTAVGMAIAERLLAARFNRDGYPLFDHRTWVFASDGDLMEGVSSEASSLAGHLGLDRLIVFYDDNEISIDGPTSLSFSEDVGRRYEAYGWHVLRVEDGNDLEALSAATEAALAESDRPSLVAVRTHIGFGSPAKQDSSAAHGSPLGADEVQATKQNLGWPEEPTFHVPAEARTALAEAAAAGARRAAEWDALLEGYRSDHAEEAVELERRMALLLPENWHRTLPLFTPDDGPIATRKASGRVLESIAPGLPELVGGSADLTPSNNTYQKGETDFSAAEPSGKNFFFGVREHAMGAALNGMALSGLLRPYGGTFLIFSDYMRPAIRLAALMELPVVYVFTHDSIFLGEDGPTHQPVSQLLSLRAIPNLTVIRPGDANEASVAWHVAMEKRDGPTALALSRQSLPVFAETASRAGEGVQRGGYVLSDPEGEAPRAILIATGSELALAMAAHRQLAEEGVPTRVVSLPSWELFDGQGPAYRNRVLPAKIGKRVAIEAGNPLGWERYVGSKGIVMGVDRFGASAPAGDLADEYLLTQEEVVRRVRQLLKD
jgi:transketolase